MPERAMVKKRRKGGAERTFLEMVVSRLDSVEYLMRGMVAQSGQRSAGGVTAGSEEDFLIIMEAWLSETGGSNLRAEAPPFVPCGATGPAAVEKIVAVPEVQIEEVVRPQVELHEGVRRVPKIVTQTF